MLYYEGNASGKGWTYNAATKTLTLNGFNYNGNYAAIRFDTDDKLKIVLEGNNSITSTDFYGIFIDKDTNHRPTLEFTGDGSLVVTSKSSSGISCSGNITIDGCKITATTQADDTGGFCSGIFAGQNLIIKNATVTATASYANNFGLGGAMLVEKGNFKTVITNSKVTATSESTSGSAIFSNYGDIEIGQNADVTATGVSRGIRIQDLSSCLIIKSNVKSVISTGGFKAIDCGIDKLKNEVTGLAWNNTEGTKGEENIDISPAGGQAVMYSKKVKFPHLLPTITTPPTALNPIFDGSEHALVTAGTAINGTMQYALQTEPFTPSKNSYSADIPTGVDIGTYYVWYRAYGNAGYGISTPKCITVTIYKEKPAPDPAPAPTPSPDPAPTPNPNPSQEDDKKENSSSNADQVLSSESDKNEKTENVDKKQKSTKLSKITAGKKSFTITWKKQTAKGIKGYEIQYSTDKSFKEDATKSVSINKIKTTSKTIKKLKPKTKYYVRIRTFAKKNGEKVYSKWSKAKNVKVK